MPSRHQCPRCAYDLSGETSRWAEACPVVGRCPECGLDFQWADVLVPSRWRLDGFVEHARGPFQSARWSWRTFWWLPAPWIFWAKVKLHHTINLWRVVLALLLGVLALHVLHVFFLSITLWRYAGAAPAVLGGATLTPPPAWAYASLFLYPIVVPEPTLAWTSVSGVAPTATCTGWALVPQHQWMHAMLLWAPIAILAWPLMFFALPITRRRAGVRWAHIRRAALYPVAVQIPLSLIALVAAAWDAAWSNVPSWLGARFGLFWGGPPRFDERLTGIVLALFPFWLGLWWLFAIRRGWRVSAAFLVWLLLQIAVALAAFIVCLIVSILATKQRW